MAPAVLDELLRGRRRYYRTGTRIFPGKSEIWSGKFPGFVSVFPEMPARIRDESAPGSVVARVARPVFPLRSTRVGRPVPRAKRLRRWAHPSQSLKMHAACDERFSIHLTADYRARRSRNRMKA